MIYFCCCLTVPCDPGGGMWKIFVDFHNSSTYFTLRACPTFICSCVQQRQNWLLTWKWLTLAISLSLSMNSIKNSRHVHGSKMAVLGPGSLMRRHSRQDSALVRVRMRHSFWLLVCTLKAPQQNVRKTLSPVEWLSGEYQECISFFKTKNVMILDSKTEALGSPHLSYGRCKLNNNKCNWILSE